MQVLSGQEGSLEGMWTQGLKNMVRKHLLLTCTGSRGGVSPGCLGHDMKALPNKGVLSDWDPECWAHLMATELAKLFGGCLELQA